MYIICHKKITSSQLSKTDNEKKELKQKYYKEHYNENKEKRNYNYRTHYYARYKEAKKIYRQKKASEKRMQRLMADLIHII